VIASSSCSVMAVRSSDIFGDNVKDISTAIRSLPPSDLIARSTFSFCRRHAKFFFPPTYPTISTTLPPPPTESDSPTRRASSSLRPPGPRVVNTTAFACGAMQHRRPTSVSMRAENQSTSIFYLFYFFLRTSVSSSCFDWTDFC
jgi:hypothetical protein